MQSPLSRRHIRPIQHAISADLAPRRSVLWVRQATGARFGQSALLRPRNRDGYEVAIGVAGVRVKGAFASALLALDSQPRLVPLEPPEPALWIERDQHDGRSSAVRS
jgi:hypothetical protein